ncbi:MAG: uppP [Rickettsiaceae bacterium]|jgi:undecaprenyl-diphosphatase|nr:uppP [Rickettsiaceae bacterium]
MDLVAIIKAIILGIVEGLTEFIPVSSTAHLLLSSKLIDFSYIKDDVFEIVIQLGAILAVVVLYRKKILDVVLGIFKKKSSQNFVLNIAIAFFPAAIIGLFFHGLIKSLFFNPLSIALAMLIGGFVILLVEKLNIKPKYSEIDDLSAWIALKIGLFQVISMIPGVSRSGATIIGGLCLKLDRKTATEFSFFLSIPTIFAASAFDFYKNYNSFDSSKLGLLLIGFATAFLSSLVVIKWFINFVSSHNFIPFAYYRIALGLILILVLI